MKERLKELLNNSRAPLDFLRYSCIVVMKDNTIFEGVNLKNAVFRDSIYAEQIAIGQAVAHGYKRGDFEKIYIMVGSEDFRDLDHIGYSVIKEFFEDDKDVVCMNILGEEITTKVRYIYTYSLKIRGETLI